jgi:putative acetyltransferase
LKLIIHIDHDDPNRADVRQLLTEHLADMFATSPPDSVHALDPSALSNESVTFWTAREEGVLLGCGALKELDARQGEIKSMRTTSRARGRGVATLVLTRIVDVASQRHYERVCLETGTQQFFAPARRLYIRNGFTVCEPFADYLPDPNSVFMSLKLKADE